ncbi:ompA family protein [Burkholderia sp. MSHR3999]|uniref:OmpA family protein n=1 Tax=Burkholderia sp. MSHR3999 TaxID=1542965 RepID=UPI0005B6CFE6|nr:OmpA family protein [Burkholderia sp. MSHR3999]KIP17193.1 ompA family protein [Burkholderia sp. MSHR3999]KIP17231.1 ompA family protein [Burkholderia sp. MSHR3999]
MSQVDILKSLESLLSEPVAQQAPAFLNESRIAVIHGFDGALANVLGGIVHLCKTSTGTESLLHVLHASNVTPDLLTRDLSGMFSGGEATSKLVETGKLALQLLFGSKIHEFNGVLSGVSGLMSKNAALLAEMVTSFVLAAIRHAATTAGPLTTSSLSAVLEAQSRYLKGRLSERLLGALGFAGIAAWLSGESHHLRDDMRATGAEVRRAESGIEREAATHKRKWLWLGLILLALLALLFLGFCSKRTPDMSQSSDAAAPASSTVSAVADAIPKGAGIIAAMMEGKPELKIYFEYGKAELSSDFAGKAKDVLAYLTDNPSSKASVSGYTDSSGDPTLNAELAKKRAESVKAALMAAGIDASRISLDKPLEVSGGTSDSKDRRVEIHVQ